MVHRIDEQGDEFAHVCIRIPGAGQQFRSMISEVGAENVVNQTLVLGFLEALKTAGKEAETGRTENSPGSTFS